MQKQDGCQPLQRLSKLLEEQYETCRTRENHSSRLPGNNGQSSLGQNREQDYPGVGRSDLGPCYLSYSDDHVLVEPLKYQDIANLSQGKPHYDMSSIKLNIAQSSDMH